MEGTNYRREWTNRYQLALLDEDTHPQPRGTGGRCHDQRGRCLHEAGIGLPGNGRPDRGSTAGLPDRPGSPEGPGGHRGGGWRDGPRAVGAPGTDPDGAASRTCQPVGSQGVSTIGQGERLCRRLVSRPRPLPPVRLYGRRWSPCYLPRAPGQERVASGRPRALVCGGRLRASTVISCYNVPVPLPADDRRSPGTPAYWPVAAGEASNGPSATVPEAHGRCSPMIGRRRRDRDRAPTGRTGPLSPSRSAPHRGERWWPPSPALAPGTLPAWSLPRSAAGM